MPGRILDTAIEFAARSSFGALLGSWLAMVLGFGVVYWLSGNGGSAGLADLGAPVRTTAEGLAESIYFSFVTATSVGFGDVVPRGWVRAAAIVEAMAGLLIFGCVISKLVSRRQEELTEEIHRMSFETRLGRVRTNLHLVLSELSGLAGACAEAKEPGARLLPLLESSAMVFTGELRAIHDLLYRPQQVPDEAVMQSLLANLAACMREFVELDGKLRGAGGGSPLLRGNLHAMSRLAGEICGECVPREYAPELKGQMDRIQDLGRRLAQA